MTIAMCRQVPYGLGQHFDTLSPDDASSVLQWMWASIWIYYLALGTAKASIILQYLRVFPQRRFRLACHTLLTVVTIYTLWGFLSAVFACSPVAYFWDQSIRGHCLMRTAVWYATPFWLSDPVSKG